MERTNPSCSRKIDDVSPYDLHGTVLYRTITRDVYAKECAMATPTKVDSDGARIGSNFLAVDRRAFTTPTTAAEAVGPIGTAPTPSSRAAKSGISGISFHLPFEGKKSSAMAKYSRTKLLPSSRLHPLISSSSAAEGLSVDGPASFLAHQTAVSLPGQHIGGKAVLEALEFLFPPVPLTDDKDNSAADAFLSKDDKDEFSPISLRSKNTGNAATSTPTGSTNKALSLMSKTSLVGEEGHCQERVRKSPTTELLLLKDQLIRVAATDCVTQKDVVQLFQHLRRRCVEEHARPRGTLCRSRERIFDDAMRELTRQVTIMCPERGLFLDELCKQMAQLTETYEVLYESACQYAVRKATERDLQSYLFDESKVLESEVRRVENRVHELQAKYDGLVKRFTEQKMAAQKAREAEISYVNRSNQQIVSEIKRLASMEANASH